MMTDQLHPAYLVTTLFLTIHFVLVLLQLHHKQPSLDGVNGNVS